MIIPPETILSLCGIANNQVIKSKLNAIESKVDLLLQKSDQLILREIRAAYQALQDALMIGTSPTSDSRFLMFI